MATQIIYNYPKTSCKDCSALDSDIPVQDSGYPTNMSVRNCKFTGGSDSSFVFREDVEPRAPPVKGYTNINPQVMTEQYAKDFQKIRCPHNLSTCKNPQFASLDPRLISVQHSGQVLTLDKPPVDGAMRLSQIAQDKKLDNWGKNYKSYSDIQAGDIMYYINKSQEDPLLEA